MQYNKGKISLYKELIIKHEYTIPKKEVSCILHIYCQCIVANAYCSYTRLFF